MNNDLSNQNRERERMYHPNDINDDSDVEEEYYDENVELEEDQPQPVRPVVQEERPLTFVLGKTLATSGWFKFSKVKRPVLFYGTKTGWKFFGTRKNFLSV